MSDKPKQINFTIVPEDGSAQGPEGEKAPQTRVYSNFCAISHTPFDFTLTFCEVMPPTEKEIQDAGPEHTIRAPVRARIVVPVQVLPNLISALQENWRVFSETYSNAGWKPGAGPVH